MACIVGASKMHRPHIRYIAIISATSDIPENEIGTAYVLRGLSWKEACMGQQRSLVSWAGPL